jgi:glycerate dehydrogenase
MAEPLPGVVWLDEPTVLPPEFVSELREFCDFRLYGGLPGPDEVVRRLAGAQVAVVERTRFDAALLERLHTVRYLCAVTTAWGHIDVAAANRCGITVANCPTYSAVSVAEYVIGALVAADRDMRGSHAKAVAGRGPVHHPLLGRGLAGQTLALVGVGAIGREVASRALALGMTVLGVSKSGAPVPSVRMVSLAEALRSADYVSVQVPHTAATHHLLDAAALELLAPHAVLVNVSRASLVDENALADRLATGRIRAAVVDDVTDPATSRLPALPRATVTTGIAWFTQQSIERNFVELAALIRSCLTETPINVVTRR